MSTRSYDNVAFDSDSDNESERRSIASDYHFVPQLEKPKSWDKFIQSEDEAKSASEKNTDFIKKGSIALKIITTCVVFFVVLAAGVVAKSSLFFMVAQAGRKRRYLPYCVDGLGLENEVDNGETYHTTYNDTTIVAWLWCIFFAFIIPESLSFLRSVRVCMMRSVGKPTWDAFLVVFAFESAYTIGVALLFYVAFPGMDSIKGLMATNCVVVFPAFLRMFQTQEKYDQAWHKHLFMALSIISFLIQIIGLIIWPVINLSYNPSEHDHYFENSWALPLGMFLASFGWWESFVQENASPLGKVNQYLYSIKRDMFEKNTRYFVYFFLSLWKILLFFFLLMIFTEAFDLLGSTSAVDKLFSEFSTSFSQSTYIISTNNGTNGDQNITYNFIEDTQYDSLASDVVTTQIICAWACYIFAKFASKTYIQRVAFSLPLTMVMPVTIAGMFGMCEVRNNDICAYRDSLPRYAFFECPVSNGDMFGKQFGWLWILFILSQFWIAFHIWFPKSQRLASTEQIFGSPYYSGLLLDQSIMLNRRSDSGILRFRLDRASNKRKQFTSVSRSESASTNKTGSGVFEVLEGDVEPEEVNTSRGKKKKLSSQQMSRPANLAKEEIPRVFGCATMWHESTEEIGEMLKSIFRIDEDYSARFLAKKILSVNDPDYYEWETHIFFDDAMEPDDTGKETVVNQFVTLLVSQVDIQGKKWYGLRNMKVPPPVKYPTPYGGRLIWTLPGQTKIICHLKDKNKIRHKKRWSQCMYMYYFLGYQLADNDRLTEEQKELRAQNTFLLALDGDVDFQPDAIIKLIDLMKRNPGVGASCGRIHPTGSGYMQWYQMFEYAIGHWLQKATEHVMGCVLCSPGCFALFRGKAVMDDNVMKTYTTVATEPRHYVQYDQGEDRWLCTLLLQQGWRVEYSAASDSFTACPEGFKEFYNQRRRWMPSTMANIMDLLSDYKRVIKNNDDISIFYILYQTMMMVGTILGPGSIYLMLVGACAVAFGLSNWLSFILNLIPLLIFVIVCLTCKSDTQIILAQVLSVGYALVMMAVLVGLLIQISEDGWLAPTTLSFLFVAFAFIISACLHPQEFWCLPMGLIYYITIPSMYLFLVIYSVFNLNVVSWGTREVPKKKTAEEMEQDKAEAEAAARQPPKKKTGIASWFQKDRFLEFSISNMFHDKGGIKGNLESMNDRLEAIEMALKREGYTVPKKEESKETEKAKDLKRNPTVRIVEPEREKRDELRNPYWIEQEGLLDGPKKFLPRKEIQFWFELIEKYLKPLDKDPEKEKQITAGLLELRNQSVFSFLMINSIWVITVFLMQENKDLLFIEWPWGPKGPNITYENIPYASMTVTLEYEYLQLEPIGLIFVLFFAVVLLIQVIGMLMHRIMTLGHIVSTTKIRLTMQKLRGKPDKFDENKFMQKRGVEFVKAMQREYIPDSNESSTTMEAAVENTLSALASGNPERFSRVSNVGLNSPKSLLKRKETVSAIRRRHTEYEKRKATVRRGPGGSTRAPPTIKEDEEDEVDDHRSNRRRGNKDNDDGLNHQKVVRTNTFADPDGEEEREV